jgi:hypothetical protein
VKKAFVALAVLAAIVSLGVLWAWYSLDFIVKVALEHYGPDVTGVAIKVDEVKLSPRDGLGSLKGVEIGNPTGYSSPRAARLGLVRVAIDPATLGDPVTVIREISVEAPAIFFERGNKGTNLDAIQRSIEAYVKRGESGPDVPATTIGGAKRKFIIERLAIRGARVTMTNPALRGQGITFDLPEIQMRDIGKRQNGVTASEAGSIVTATVIARIAQRVLTSVELLRKGGREGAVDALKGLLR